MFFRKLIIMPKIDSGIKKIGEYSDWCCYAWRYGHALHLKKQLFSLSCTRDYLFACRFYIVGYLKEK